MTDRVADEGTARPALKVSASALILACIASPAGAASNHYNVAISAGATGNVAFSNGIYSPTAPHAVLNVGDLQSALAAGNVEVTTGSGTGGKQAGDLTVAAAFNWASGHSLTLDAYHSVSVNGSVADNGTGAVTLTTNDGGTNGMLSFGPKGSLSFLGTSDALTINGHAYTLVANIAALAAGIAANPSGFYALAASYDASQDGTYASAPIPTDFTGTFEGLGNAFKRLTIVESVPARIGLFALIDTLGAVNDLRLINVHVRGEARESVVGSLAGGSAGTLSNDTASGTVQGARASYVGGLVGGAGGLIVSCASSASVTIIAVAQNEGGGFAGGLIGELEDGTVSNSSASGSVAARNYGARLGGLVGEFSQSGSTTGRISGSYATGTVTGGENASVGGLIGLGAGAAEEPLPQTVNSYATGNVIGGASSNVGGFIGFNVPQSVTISDSYATGAVSGGMGSFIGGFSGQGGGGAQGTDDYWDTTTSGTNTGDGGGPRMASPG